MAASQNFRSAFNGFNREDVVHYLEYLNTKHTNQVNQLTAENEALRAQVAALPDLESQQLLVSSLENKCAELARQLEEAQARCAELEQTQVQPEETPVQEPVLSPSASDELEAYRRAERIEREAKERAELVYFQANSVLTEATAKVDGISADITEMADKVMIQLTQLQVAVGSSKQALQDASSIMGAIRPNK
ncbi:MAG: hypothetical protein Q4F81_01385 [Eubacteriales bacterium]|nr:hypothetical protein [Eubacteriales bacterium]